MEGVHENPCSLRPPLGCLCMCGFSGERVPSFQQNPKGVSESSQKLRPTTSGLTPTSTPNFLHLEQPTSLNYK